MMRMGARRRRKRAMRGRWGGRGRKRCWSVLALSLMMTRLFLRGGSLLGGWLLGVGGGDGGGGGEVDELG